MRCTLSPSKAFGDADAIGFVADRLGKRRQVLLMVHHLHVDDGGRASPDDGASSPEQIAGASHVFGIDVAGGKVAASQQHGQFLGVDAIALGFATMDGFEVERVSQQEAKVLLMAEIGQPIPVEGRFAADDQIALVKRLQCDQKLLRFLGVEVAMQVLVAAVIDDADVHGVGVQIDSAVEFVLLIVELQSCSSLSEWA